MNYCTSNGPWLGHQKMRRRRKKKWKITKYKILPAQIKPKGVLCISLCIYI
jgi:hypothetical protein